MEFKIYIFEDFDSVSIQKLMFLQNFLPEDRKQTMQKCFYERDRQIKTIEYFLVKQALKFDGIKKFRYTKNGKPFLPGFKNFNISHTSSSLIVGISDKKIGVDVQDFIDYEEKLAKHICSKKELLEINKSKNKSWELTKLWVMKEALIKLKGLTIARNLKTLLRKKSLYKFNIFETCGGLGCVCQKK